MAIRLAACAAGAVLVGIVCGCSSPMDAGRGLPHSFARSIPADADRETLPKPDHFRAGDADAESTLAAEPTLDDYVRYALEHSTALSAAQERWVAAAQRLPQAGALPDPRLNVGFFLDAVETRTGPQHARIGVSQSFPWPGLLGEREDAEALAARAAWRRYEAQRLAVTERVVETLYELAYLDSAAAATGEMLELLRSFEEVVRTRYRVGTGTHPELVRVQVEMSQTEDRLAQLRSMRPAYVAELNAALNRPSEAETPTPVSLPGRVAQGNAESLTAIAVASNPSLQELDERIGEQRVRTEIARLRGRPEFTVGLDYIVTGEARTAGVTGSGDDPVLLSFGLTLPLWRDKYDAGVRESIAERLAVTHDRSDTANRIAAAIQRVYFEHTDADRRAALYERTLIPKAEESLRASLAGFRAGETGFLDLLDTERTLLEFTIALERAKADRGIALARLAGLVGAPIPTTPSNDEETR
ncbi:MAG: TolC family protein [Phycisphaeraceae bacterium]|nr:TolC family protein [Phycisphaeraceae bacterium]